MPWEPDQQVKDFLEKLGMLSVLKNCHDCGAQPGEVHKDNCDVERCSVCGNQYIQCGCPEHDRAFARWTGLWPGYAEMLALGKVSHMERDIKFIPLTGGESTTIPHHYSPDLNGMYAEGLHKIFFVKPKVK
jgi:hypothetical protein